MATVLDELLVKLSGDSSDYDRMMKRALENTKRYTDDILREKERASGRSLDQLSPNVARARQSDAAQEAMQRQLKTMEAGIQVTRSVETSSERYARTVGDLGRMLQQGAISQTTYNRAMEQAAQHTDAAASAQARMAAGAAALAGLIAATKGIGHSAVEAASQFEYAMAHIEGLSGAAREDVEAWSKSLLQMAPLVGKMPEELAKGLYFISSGGQKGQVALDTLGVSARAAAAGLGEVKTVAFAVKSAINAYAASGMTAAAAGDVLTAAVREGKLEAASLAPVLSRLLPMAQSMGIGFADVAASLSAMTRTGANAAEAATSLQAFMMALQKPGEGSQDLLLGTNLSFQKLRDIVRKPGGVVEAIRLMKATFGESETALSRLTPNVRAFRGVMNILAQDAKKIDGVFKAVNNATGDLDRAFEIAAKTMHVKYEQAMAAAAVASVELGQALAPAAGKVLEAFRSMTDAWNRLDATTKGWIATAGAAVVGLTAIANAAPIAAAALVYLAKTTAAFALALVTSPVTVYIGLLGALGVAVHEIVMHYSGGAKAVEEMNRALSRSAELQDQLAKAQGKQTEGIVAKAAGIGDTGERRSFLESELKKAEKDAKAYQERLKGMQEKLGKESFLTFLGRGLAFLPALGGAFREELDQAKQAVSLFEQARKRIESLRGEMGKLPGGITGETKIDVSELERALAMQNRQLGMTSQEIEIYKKKLEGATEAQLTTARALVYQHKEFERFKKATDDAKEFTQAMREQAATMGMSADEARLYRLEMGGYVPKSLLEAARAAFAQKQAVEASRKELEAYQKSLEEGKRVTEQYMTPQEKFKTEVSKLDSLFDAGAIGAATYTRAIQSLEKSLDGAARAAERLDAAAFGSAEHVGRIRAFQDLIAGQRMASFQGEEAIRKAAARRAEAEGMDGGDWGGEGGGDWGGGKKRDWSKGGWERYDPSEAHAEEVYKRIMKRVEGESAPGGKPDVTSNILEAVKKILEQLMKKSPIDVGVGVS